MPELSDDPDLVLIERIKLRDQDALYELAKRYHRTLWAFLMPRLECQQEWVREVEQDVLLGVWKSAGAFRGDSLVKTWLFGIAEYCASNTLRSRSYRAGGPSIQLPKAPDDFADDDRYSFPSHEDTFANREEILTIWHGLPADLRAILDLACVQRMPYSEIAMKLGIPIGTVKSRVFRARHELRQRLQNVSRLDATKFSIQMHPPKDLPKGR